MSPAEIADAVRRRLAAEVDDDRGVLARLHDRVLDLSREATDARAEAMRPLALAFEIERWYSAAEAVLERIVRTVDGDVPSGPTWHAELLRAAAVAVHDLRPTVLNREAAAELRELLKFRHFARHGYDRDPDPARMNEHAARVGRAHAALSTSLDVFVAWLRTAASPS
jgi:hypothetical protein